MEFFLRDPAGVVPKGVPPDKSVGAWPSVQEKTTGVGNVGKSPCEGTNAENQSLNVQENPREHSVVANQEDIPTGERAGIHLLPRPVLSLRALRLACSFFAGVALDLKERNSMLIIQERFCKHQSLSTLYTLLLFIATLLLLKFDDARPSQLIADMRRKTTFDRAFPEKNIRDCRWAPIEKFQLPAYYFVLVVPMLAAYLLHAERTHCPGCADIFSLPSTSF